jgi:glycosyltransferase involved in cell wall biosynthesis
MKLAIISHAYIDPNYLPVLESISARPNVELAFIFPSKYKGECLSWETRSPIRKVPVPIRFGSRQGAFSYLERDLVEALDLFEPDIILHEQEVYALGAGQIAAIAANRSIPLVFFVWENVHRTLSLPRRLLRSYVLSKSSGLIAGSTKAAQVHRDWGFHGPITVIPQMGVNVSANPAFGRREETALRICFAGRLVACKGVDCLLRAVAILRDQRLPISCTIAGQGPELKRMTSLTRRFAIQHLVDFCGHKSGADVLRLFRQSDVLVLPSRRTRVWEEQFGRVLAEAMAEATVTVGSKTGAIPEVIGSDELLFEEGDSAGLAQILHRLATRPDIFLAHQRRLWCRAKERYSNQYLACQRVMFLEEILETASGPKPICGLAK